MSYNTPGTFSGPSGLAAAHLASMAAVLGGGRAGTRITFGSDEMRAAFLREREALDRYQAHLHRELEDVQVRLRELDMILGAEHQR